MFVHPLGKGRATADGRVESVWCFSLAKHHPIFLLAPRTGSSESIWANAGPLFVLVACRIFKVFSF